MMKIKQRIFYTCLLFLILSQSHLVKAESIQMLTGLEQNSAVSEGELDQAHGMGGVVDITTHNDINVDGVLTGNTANNNVTGFNVIDNGAFTDAGGFISVIQNTGNNVLIQDTTLININVVN